MKGRKPKPTALKVLQGNPGKRPINAKEPTPPPLAESLALPVELEGNEIAQREWKRLAPMLQLCRQVTEADLSALLAVCLEWARYLDATRKVRELGMVVKAPSGYPIVNPYLSIATKALAGCNKLWPELGLTPSSRSRVQTAGKPAPSFDDARFFGGPVGVVGSRPS